MDSTTTIGTKPRFSPQQATKLIQQLYGVAIAKISPLPSYFDQNFRAASEDGTEYVLKIMNSKVSKNATMLEVQTLAMSFLHQQGFPVHTALPTTTGLLMSMEERDFGSGAQTYCVRLMYFVPGETLAKCPVTQQDLYHVGKLAATVDKTLELFQQVSSNVHVLQPDNWLWYLSNAPLVEGYLSVMDGDPLQEVVKAVIKEFKLSVLPRINSFQKGIIHGDLSDANVILKPAQGGHHEVSGILDFSLLTNGCYVFELAITIMYLMLENPRPLDVGGAVIAGWESVMVLNEDEKDSLFLLVLGHLCQTLVYGRDNARRIPENKECFLATSKNGTKLLSELWALGKKEVEQRWFCNDGKYIVNV